MPRRRHGIVATMGGREADICMQKLTRYRWRPAHANVAAISLSKFAASSCQRYRRVHFDGRLEALAGPPALISRNRLALVADKLAMRRCLQGNSDTVAGITFKEIHLSAA